MPIDISIFYDSEQVGTSVSFETQINLKKSSEKKAEEIEDQLKSLNLSIDDDPQEEEIILESTTTEEEDNTLEEGETATTEDETAEAESDEATTEEEKNEEVEDSEEEEIKDDESKEDPLLARDSTITLEELEIFELPPEPEVDMKKINEKLEELPEIDDIMEQEEIDIVAAVSELFTSEVDECESED